MITNNLEIGGHFLWLMVNISMCDHNKDAVRLVVGIEALVHGLSDVDGVVKQNCVFALYYLSFDDVNMRMLRRMSRRS